ncbi:prohibitin family protein [Mucilaginibacter aquaedulcis]|uniref:prohibitin family protein n=1 Tax=Mucilaginibacter aquaedulcis TaxID=1187081 RepID=UPI0025B6102A|nr:prohibitin family protein [Mucilaginibacter aquaedulcis]MDN3546946.1 prohibitin family protein [Mucilaginibacter aquaedulcis]
MSQRRINILLILLVSLLLLVVFIERFMVINGPATASILFRPFGGGVDKHAVYGEGIHFVSPWNSIYKFNTREQMVQETMHIMVQNGVTVSLLVNYRYTPLVDSLPAIFEHYGMAYDKVYINPEIVSTTSELLSQFTPEQIYTLKIDSIRTVALLNARERLIHGNILLGNLVISNIKLPKKVVTAIESKLQQQQLAIEYNYKIAIAEKERQIKIIDGQATQAVQGLVNRGLTPGYLQYKQIEALLKLSTSPNAKTIVLPKDANTPLILGNGQ